MGKQKRKVIHVELKNPPKGFSKNYYFGSVAAIFDTLQSDIVGIRKESLWNAIANSHEYKGKKAIIRSGTIIAKDTNRGVKC